MMNTDGQIGPVSDPDYWLEIFGRYMEMFGPDRKIIISMSGPEFEKYENPDWTGF